MRDRTKTLRLDFEHAHVGGITRHRSIDDRQQHRFAGAGCRRPVGDGDRSRGHRLAQCVSPRHDDRSGATDRGQVVFQDRPFELPKLWRGFDAEFLGERRAEVGVGAQCLGLALIAVERSHVQGPGALAQRVLSEKEGEVGDRFVGPAELHQRLDTSFGGGDAEVVQSHGDRARPLLGVVTLVRGPRHNPSAASRVRRAPWASPASSAPDPCAAITSNRDAS